MSSSDIISAVTWAYHDSLCAPALLFYQLQSAGAHRVVTSDTDWSGTCGATLHQRGHVQARYLFILDSMYRAIWAYLSSKEPLASRQEIKHALLVWEIR